MLWCSSSSRISLVCGRSCSVLSCCGIPGGQTKIKTLRRSWQHTPDNWFYSDQSPSCVIPSPSLSPTSSDVGGVRFLSTAPGSSWMSLLSITTPLSVVTFDTAESPRTPTLLPASSWQQRGTVRNAETYRAPFPHGNEWSRYGGIFVFTHCHEHSSSRKMSLLYYVMQLIDQSNQQCHK